MNDKNEAIAHQSSTSTATSQNRNEPQPKDTNLVSRIVLHHHKAQQVPIPEPRKRFVHSSLSTHKVLDLSSSNTKIAESVSDELSQGVRLVNVRNWRDDEFDLEHGLDRERQNQVNQIHPIDGNRQSELESNTAIFTTDDYSENLNGSVHTTVDYEDGIHENEDEEYFVDEECHTSNSERQEELKALSRQSMVPLNELIAYYQYIQQGNTDNPKSQARTNLRSNLSRRSSCSSQGTTKTKHSFEGSLALDNRSQDSSNSVITITSNSYQHNPARDVEVHQIPHNKSIDLLENETISMKRVPDILVEEAPEDHVDGQLVQQTEDLINDNEVNEVQMRANQRENRRRMRANVILELINSERDFVKHLKDVVEGYLCPSRRHPEIFTGERINTIFSNIEQVYEFQTKFLSSLESCIDWKSMADSVVGHCFLDYEKGFSVYHHYCNNHPNATTELQDLYTKPRFVKFFEACRLLQNMIDISLDGFLLTPIQKICKYPLQLNELLKNTDEDHPDYHNVVDALESMRNCANLANERKRRIEALADIMSFQEKFENWFGPKLSDTSSILIHSGEVSKMSSHTWSQGIQLHLFDHLLLLSKKDLLKRNNLILKSRISMDTITEISDADEYKPKKSFKLYCGEQLRWFVFTTRSELERDEWIQAFEKERNLVQSDENEGFHITDREIGVARRALQNRKHSRSARYRHKRPDTTIVDQLDLDDANAIMNRTLSLPSCIHPSHVMNFVEDSKIVSSRRNQLSPNSSARSPTSGSKANMDEQQIEGDSVANTSWFRKMGSKKLAKSQIYNINGSGHGSFTTGTTGIVSAGSIITSKAGLQPAAGRSTVAKPRTSSPNVPSTSSVLDDFATAAKTYDQLEKRHRDHMVSEEQARLYRLNNDLPPASIFNPTNNKPLMDGKHVSRGGNDYRTTSNQLSHRRPTSDCGGSVDQFHNDSIQHQQPHSLDFASQINSNVPSFKQSPEADKTETTATEYKPTFETTVVLSSGRVVRVREYAV